MMKTKEEIIAFIRENPLFFIATVDENNLPHVRAIMMHKVDEKGIIFTTGKNKDLYKQLKKNPQVELCFYNNQSQVRIAGTAVDMDENIALKQEIVSSRPFMLSWIEAVGYEVMGLFSVRNCKATYWSMKMPLSRKRFISLFETD